MVVTLQSKSGEKIECPIGFSWTTLFFGVFVPLIRGDWKWFVIMLLAGGSTLGISWFVFPFVYNGIFVKDRLGRGFDPINERDASLLRGKGFSASFTPTSATPARSTFSQNSPAEHSDALKPLQYRPMNPNEVQEGFQHQEVSVSLVEQFDFSGHLVPDWPVEIHSGTIEKTIDAIGSESFSATVMVSNAQGRTIKYMEWELELFDILKRPIVNETQVLVRHEQILEAGQSAVATTDKVLPSRTKSFIPRLAVVLYEDGQILQYDKDAQVYAVDPRKEVEGFEGFEAGFPEFFQKKYSLPSMPKYMYGTDVQGIWTCAFCGSRNKGQGATCRRCGTACEHQQLCTGSVMGEELVVWAQQQEESRLQEAEHFRVLREKAEQDARELQKEQERARQVALAQKLRIKQVQEAKARKKNIWMTVIVLLLVVAIIVWALLVGRNIGAYGRANSFLESGAYYEAYEEFAALEGYKDARERSLEAYTKYIPLMGLADQVEGWKWLASQGVAEAYEELYSISGKLETEGSFLQAFQGFRSLGEYKDSDARFLDAYRKFVHQQPSLEFRLEGYQWLVGHGYSQELLYDLAFSQRNDASAAYPIFMALGDYKDALGFCDELEVELGLGNPLL
ncbi:MAG: hypothetical protein RBR15_17380 [Sphaerochaeta sp.]|nr:hypothetical protein [Sphaerochaeta sp.]